MQDLDRKVRPYLQALPAYSEDIQLACEYVEPDAGSSLTKSRIVMEKLLIEVFKREMGTDPRKPLLGEILADNQFTRKLDRRILSRMNAIRDMGNLGPHGERVEASDAARVLDDLCVILDWYLQRYGHGASGDTASSAETRVPKRKLKKFSADVFAKSAGCSVAVAFSFMIAAGAAYWWFGNVSRRGPIPAAVGPGSEGAQPFKGPIDILVWKSGKKDEGSKRLHEPGVLPLKSPKNENDKNADGLRIEVELNRPGYMYVVWLDSSGKVTPVYPWIDQKWNQMPAEQQKRDSLSWPENTNGQPVFMDPGPSGIESLILLVRDEPWPADKDIAALFAGLPRPKPAAKNEPIRAAAWFENGKLITKEKEQDRGAINEKRILEIDDPLLHLQDLLRTTLKSDFPYSRAVCFSVQGE
jgi:hypothetical protein